MGQVAGLAAGLVGPGAALDHRVHVLEVARVGREGHGHAPARQGRVGAAGAVVVLHVAGAALGRRGVHGQRLLALEFGEDRLVGPADRVREHVETAAVGHAHHHLARAVGRAELDRLVEHGHERVEALDRELLLAQEGLVQIALQGLDLRQAPQQPPPGLLVERLAVGTRLDRLAQPHALLVVGDVLDLVGDRARVGVAQSRQRVREGLARHRHAQDRRRDAPHQVVGELDRGRLEGRIAHRRRAERVELRGQVPVHAVGLDQRGGRLHCLEQRRIGHGAGRRDGGGGHRLGGGDRGGLGRSGAPVDAQAVEHSLVEAVGALQELVHPAQEGARFRALDHPVVVGAGHGHDLLHAQLTQLVRGSAR